MIAAAVALMFLGAFGDRVERLRYGDAEMTLKLLDKAREADALGDERAKEALVGAALAASGVSTGLAAGIDVRDKRRLHQDAVMNAVLKAIQPIGGELQFRREPIAAIATLGDRKVGIDTRRDPDALKSRLTRIGERLGRVDVDALLVVVRSKKAEMGIDEAERDAAAALGVPVRVIRWRQDRDDESSLTDVALELLRR